MTGHRGAGSFEIGKSHIRHCEPPLKGWQEQLNQNEGARQSAFGFLS
jgi:hypothetical protein